MTSWKITGIIATIVILLSIPGYLVKQKYTPEQVESQPAAVFVGGQKCAECHKSEYDKWKGSHHDLAMDEATAATVLGDFDNARFEYFDVTSRFYRKNDRFFVFTRGPAGKMGEFEI